MNFLAPVWNYVDALVHPVAQQDALTAARHRSFIAPRLLGSLVALACIPVYLAFRGVPSALEVAVFGWLLAPILIAYFLSRTGRYESAQVLSSLALTGLVTLVAWRTGGIDSFAAVWLVIVPFEAALSASRRVVTLASISALAAAGLLLILTAAHILLAAPATVGGHAAFAALGIISAGLYSSGLAFNSAQVTSAGIGLLHAEEDRYRLLAHNMSDVITRHGRNGAVLFVSPAADSLLRVPASALMGHGLFDRVHVADRPAYLTALADAAALGAESSVEFRIRCGGEAEPHDQFVWIEMRCQPLDQVADGALGGDRQVVAVLRDMTERKRQEQALESARAESERANAAKGRFLATMSHELRTPLNGIIGFSDILANESLPLDAARRGEYARLINDSGRHLLSVVNGILDTSKIESGNFQIVVEPFAPAQVITHCCELLVLKAREAGVALETDIESDLPEMIADRRALNQILLNLISNAIKFTPREGHVMVQAHRAGSMLVIMVEDTGIGIGAEDLPRLGEAFFQAHGGYDRLHDGAGLGLSIVKGLVHLHGGDMDIRSRLGQGTQVSIRLPMVGKGTRQADPIELAGERAEESAAVVKMPVKKSA